MSRARALGPTTCINSLYPYSCRLLNKNLIDKEGWGGRRIGLVRYDWLIAPIHMRTMGGLRVLYMPGNMFIGEIKSRWNTSYGIYTTITWKLNWQITSFTVCPRSIDPFYIASYYLKWVKTSWTYRRTSNKIFV